MTRVSDIEEAFAFQLRALYPPGVWPELDGRPQLVREYRFAPPRRWRFDFAWPNHKLAVEIEGGIYTAGRHGRGQGMEADMEKYNTAVLLGWRVLRFSKAMVEDGRALAMVEEALR